MEGGGGEEMTSVVITYDSSLDFEFTRVWMRCDDLFSILSAMNLLGAFAMYFVKYILLGLGNPRGHLPLFKE